MEAEWNKMKSDFYLSWMICVIKKIELVKINSLFDPIDVLIKIINWINLVKIVLFWRFFMSNTSIVY